MPIPLSPPRRERGFSRNDAGMFFPNPWFGWCFYVLLMGLLTVASYFDLRYLTIPKPLSIATLVLGIIMSLVRGVWIGIEAEDWVQGLGYGLSESLIGFVTGFGIFVTMWFLGLAGGGDVKLFAGVAAWLGCYYAFWLWVGSMLTLVLFASARLIYHVMTVGMSATRHSFSAKDAASGKKKTASLKPRRRLLPYSLPLAVAAALMLLWFFREDLGLADALLGPNASQLVSSLPQ
jgi:prepilin peptidase CpaA